MKAVHGITIHHHGKDMLADCLTSLLECRDLELEVVTVLNGCDEELPAIVEMSPHVHTARLERPVGFSEANNLGVRWARENLGEADYYYFINNDTRSEPEALSRLVERLESSPDAAVAGPLLLIQWAPDHLNSLGLNVTEDAWGWDEGIGIHRDDYGPLPGCRPVLGVTGSALLMDVEVFAEVGGWSEIYDYYFEDIDLCLKARQAGYEVLNEPAAVVYHQVSATMTLESDYKHFLFWRNRLVLAMVHWPLRRLMRLTRWALVDEILRRRKIECEVQRRALKSALRKLPAALGLRLQRRRGYDNWVPFLRPKGSVPVITLPENSK